MNWIKLVQNNIRHVRLYKGAEFNVVDEDGVGNLDMKTLSSV
jgi:hypothetical protein